MPVETRSRAALAMRDIQAIEESVPRVRDALGDERQEGGGEREVASHLPRPRLGVNNRPRGGPNGNAPPVGRVGRPRRLRRLRRRRRLGVGSLDVSDPPAHPAIHPSRPRELSLDVPASPRARASVGTRVGPGHAPSHRKTRSSRAGPRRGDFRQIDPDAHTPAHVTEMHISQFAESLRALRDLGISGIRDLEFRVLPRASEEQESEVDARPTRGASRAREMVRKLERDKEMQAEQLRMMEERMIDHELTEEELAAMEELRCARGDAADAARAKSARGGTRQANEMGEAWSRPLREAEEGSV